MEAPAVSCSRTSSLTSLDLLHCAKSWQRAGFAERVVGYLKHRRTINTREKPGLPHGFTDDCEARDRHAIELDMPNHRLPSPLFGEHEFNRSKDRFSLAVHDKTAHPALNGTVPRIEMRPLRSSVRHKNPGRISRSRERFTFESFLRFQAIFDRLWYAFC